MNEQPEPGQSWLTFFKEKNQFADLILTAWCTSEFNLDQIFTRQFGKHIHYPDAKILTDMPFGKKLDYLKKMEIISNEEYSVIRKFQEFRNKLFHEGAPTYVTWSDSEKEKWMDEAIKTTHVLRDVLILGDKREKIS